MFHHQQDKVPLLNSHLYPKRVDLIYMPWVAWDIWYSSLQNQRNVFQGDSSASSTTVNPERLSERQRIANKGYILNKKHSGSRIESGSQTPVLSLANQSGPCSLRSKYYVNGRCTIIVTKTGYSSIRSYVLLFPQSTYMP